MYKSGKSKSRRWSEWSEWVLHPEYNRYYRQRQDDRGEVDYEWYEGGGSTSTAVTDDHTPRDTGLEDITQGIANIQAPSGHYNEQKYAVSSGSRSKSSKSKSSSRHKEKQRAYSDDDDTEKEDAGSSSRYAAYPTTGDYSDYSGTANVYHSQPSTTPQHQPAGSAYAHQTDAYGYPTAGQSANYPPESYEQLDDDPDLQEAIANSRKYNYSGYSAGESSASAYDAYDYDDEGPPTPKGASSTHISAYEGVAEQLQLDPRYRVEHSTRFQPGEIFKVLWSEPQGNNEGAPSVSDRHEFKDKFGSKFFVGFRRFIVIANDQGHCTCVPILTYGGKGCKKRGVKPEKHGIVYERGGKARLLNGEPKLGFEPARVEITKEGEKLSKESRVNYSKLVTVEHNVKVFFIGNVVAGDWEIVSDAVNKCWATKIHHKRKHFK